MPSALLTGLAIVGIGAAGAATGGLALGAFAPSLVAGGTIGATTATLGGFGFSFLGAAGGFGIGTTIASALLGRQPIPPSPGARAALRKQPIADAEMPRTTQYGSLPVGFLRAWHNVPDTFLGGDDEFEVVDGVLANHAIDSIVGVQIGDDYLPITTDNGAAEGLILKSLTTSPGDGYFALLPDEYYVPVPNSRYRKVDNTKKSDNTPIVHLAFRFYTDGVGVVDTFTNANAEGNYADFTRKYTVMTRFHAWIRGNNELNTLQVGVRLLFVTRGKNDIWDPRGGGSTGYSENCALIVADMCKRFFSIPQSDLNTTALEAAADVCDNTGWDPQSTDAKYVFHDLLRDDEDKHSNLMRAVAHMAGSISERGREIVIHAGGARTKEMSLGPAEMVALGRLIPPQETELFNSVVPHYVPTFDDDGRVHGDLKPVDEVTVAQYQTDDGGVRRPVDRQYDGNNLGRRAKFLASIDLERPRVMNPVGATYIGVFKRRALPIEKFDVVGITDPDWWVGELLFEVQDIEIDLFEFTVQLTCIPYADSIYTPAATVTEEPVGRLGQLRDNFVPAVTNLAFDSVNESISVEADGTIRVNVLATWDEVFDVDVKDGGDFRIKWWPTGSPDDFESAVADGLATQKLLRNLVVGNYEGQIRGRGRGNAVRSEWSPSTPLAFAVAANVDPLRGIVPDQSPGAEQVANFDFAQGSGPARDGAPNWNLAGVGSDTDGSATRVTTGGQTTPPAIEVSVDASVVSNVFAIESLERIPITNGNFYRAETNIFRADAGVTASSVKFEVTYYDQDGVFIAAEEIFDGTINLLVPGGFNTIFRNFQIPHYLQDAGLNWKRVAQARPKIRFFADATGTDPVYRVDYVSLKERPVGVRGNVITAPKTIDGDDGYIQIVGSGRDIYPAPIGQQIGFEMQFDLQVDLTAYGETEAPFILYRVAREPESGTPGSSTVIASGELGNYASGSTVLGEWQTRTIFVSDSAATINQTDESQYRYRLRLAIRTSGDAELPTNPANASLTVRQRGMGIAVQGDADTLEP